MILGTTPDNPKTKFGPLAHFGMLLKTQHRFIQQGLLMIVDSYCRIFDKTVSELFLSFFIFLDQLTPKSDTFQK